MHQETETLSARALPAVPLRPGRWLSVLLLVALAAGVCLGGEEKEKSPQNLNAGELIVLAERAADKGEMTRAAYLYDVAARRGRGAERLLARHRMSRLLIELGNSEKALSTARALRSVSRPGDQLWKHAMVTSVLVHGEQKSWKKLVESIAMLRANAQRYGDPDELRHWLMYREAAARVQICMHYVSGAAALYGLAPAEFGTEKPNLTPLKIEQINIEARGYGDGSCAVTPRDGLINLFSEGAQLRDLLKEYSDAMGQRMRNDGPRVKRRIYAHMRQVHPRAGLEIVLASIGLNVEEGEGELLIRPMNPASAKKEQLVARAALALQEFLVLNPRSPFLPEAYYALAHTYVVKGDVRSALGQIEILTEAFTQSRWTVRGCFLSGKILAEKEKWGAAEEKMLLVADTMPKHPVVPRAMLWAGEYRMKQKKYEEARPCFERSLAGRLPRSLAARALYGLAYCLEQTDSPEGEAEQRYRELVIRYAGTSYADHAAFRLATMAREAGEHDKAMQRYEKYLEDYSLAGLHASEAARDLLGTYMKTGRYGRAVLLGEILRSNFRNAEERYTALPFLLKAYREAGMSKLGLRCVNESLNSLPPTRPRGLLYLKKAEFLADLGRDHEARSALEKLRKATSRAELLDQGMLVEAQILRRDGLSDRALATCKKVAEETKDAETLKKALKRLGACYEEMGEYKKAALAYEGKRPVPTHGSEK